MAFKKTLTDEERFWQKVNKTKTCWLWTGCKDRKGYGKFWFNKKVGKAHRGAYILFKGPIPDGLSVCHSCDIPACVNPEHLWLGTIADNSIDMHKKNRQPPQNRPQTHCRKGHEYSVVGTWVHQYREIKNDDGTITVKVYRKCKECSNNAHKKRLSDPKKLDAFRERHRNYARSRAKPSVGGQMDKATDF